MSEAAKPNSDITTKPSKGREEGELSSSSDDELQPGSATKSTIATVTAAEPIPAAPVSKTSAGKSVHANFPPSSVDTQFRKPTQQTNSRSFEKKRVPYRSPPSGWHGPSGTNSNLVISFSDNDSGSDSEGDRQVKASETKAATPALDGNRRPPTSITTKRNEPKVVPKKLSLSRTFLSSVSNITGSKSRVGGPKIPERGSHVRGSNQGMRLNNSELQDLRQQIAIRESELKLKSTQQSKEMGSSSFGDFDVLNGHNDATRKSGPTSSAIQLETSEPDKKRLKVNDNRLNSDVQLEKPHALSISALKEPVLEHSSLQERLVGNRSQHDKQTSVVRVPSHIVKYEGQDKQVSVVVGNRSSGVKEGIDIVANFRRSERSGRLVNPLIFQNSVNIAGRNDMDLQSLVEMEELQDKELEEAQDHRRRCEIEERNALKAYRRAQKALVEANARCAYLYSRRELSSAQAQFDVFNQAGYDSNIHYSDGVIPNASSRRVDGHNLGSEPCSEPDASTSELLPCRDRCVENGVCSPSNDPSTSADEDGVPFDPVHAQPNLLLCGGEVESSNPKDAFGVSNNFSNDRPQDSLLLEQSLRSKLFERLGMRTLVKNRGPEYGMERAAEHGAENDVASEKTQMITGNAQLSESGNIENSDTRGNFTGTDRPENGPSDLPVHYQAEKCSHNHGSRSLYDPDDNGFSLADSSATFLRSAFGHMKASSPISLMGLQTRKEQGIIASSDEIYPPYLLGNTTHDTIMDTRVGEISSYAGNLAIDPFWPLCMYELRGKCNNEECHWQHIKGSNRNRNPHNSSHNADFLARSSTHREKPNGATKLSKSLNCHAGLAPPTYLVSSDILKSEPRSYSSVLSLTMGSCWQKCFSSYLTVSSLLPKDLSSNEPILRENDGRIEVHGSWNRQSLYFQCRNSERNPYKQGFSDNDRSLETALLVLNEEANKMEGMKKALHVLSRALDANSTSVTLWIVYLHIYYSAKSPTEKDDMFFHAVKRNEGSYELWLMFINSRIHLEEKLVAYDTALSALCRHISDSDEDTSSSSQCILDLFLQMLDFLRMTKNFEKGTKMVYELVTPTSTDSNNPTLLLSDILKSLTISDKCIFWVCCVYFVIYGKLPESVVHQFESEKDLFGIEWPPRDPQEVVVDEKNWALKLIEMAVYSVNREELLEPKTAQRSLQMFALNHFKCMVALDGLEPNRNLLDKYIKLYPSCMEFVLISARARKHDSEESNFPGFEEALSNWPKEVSGIQCIWNQYAEYALRNRNLDFSKQLMERWFHSVWNVQTPSDNTESSMFGLLNLSLHKLLQNNHNDARLAINEALKVASAKDFKHCVIEHAMFFLTDGSHKNNDASSDDILKILRSYMVDPRVAPTTKPFSLKFIENIKKPRIKHLVNNILCPISPDSCLVNMVFETWYGPSLLPESSDNLKDLVDFIEAVMEISPSNYQVTISICKLVRKISRCTKTDKTAPAGVLFWASFLLVNTISVAVPVAPEYVWVEAAGILGELTTNRSLSEKFYTRALSVYPFSINLWKSYLKLSYTTGNTKAVVEAAREKGIKLD